MQGVGADGGGYTDCVWEKIKKEIKEIENGQDIPNLIKGVVDMLPK